MKILRALCVGLFGLSFVWACGFDDTLREYLNVHFWLPFVKQPWHFERKDVQRSDTPFAGMVKGGSTPLAKLRDAYREGSDPDRISYNPAALQQALAAARSAQSLTTREREEVRLIDAKIDLRAGSPDNPGPLENAKKKLNDFLRTARDPDYLSEARGWLGHVYYSLGDQTAAGKIYLDELNRSGSNLSGETLINSLRLTYGYDGGPKLVQHLDEYFDTPEHAAFAIQLVTNPRWERGYRQSESRSEPVVDKALPYERITNLLNHHRDLLRSENGANSLASLGMRAALRAGDPGAALRIAAAVPGNATIRDVPDFNWMLASAYFLSRHYSAAERPLLSLFRSSRSSDNQKSAAAYGLCGVYQKRGNPVQQIRFALWLHSHVRANHLYLSNGGTIEDQSVYWASSGWDLGLLLDAEAPIAALSQFVQAYPHLSDVDLARYSLAVRLARENRYDEAARAYEAMHARLRASRMRQLASLYQEANESAEAKYNLAKFISAHPDGIYFNDRLWGGLQRYALFASKDSQLTGEERRRLMKSERRLKDDQEERWRAYLLLREVALESRHTDLGRRAAQLGIRCLRGISERFERNNEVRAGDIELSALLRHD